MTKFISKTEMKAIFKIEKLSLDFPTGSQTGHEITDWAYWYHQTTYESYF